MLKKIFGKVSFLTFSLMMFFSQVTYADPIQDSVYAKGTKNLVTDLTAWLTGLIPASCGLYILWQLYRKKYSNGEGGVHSDADKKIKNALIIAVIGTTVSGLVALITGYFK